MNRNRPRKWNKELFISIFCVMLEGLLSGCNFMVMYYVFQSLWNRQMAMGKILEITGGIAVIFLLRLMIYSYGYVKGQIGGANVSKEIRLFLGEKLRRIPLSRFQKSQTGEYINVATENVNSYEQILTHKMGDIIKNMTLSVMLVIFVAILYAPSVWILLIAELLFLPAIAISFYAVKKYGMKKNAICAENVSSMVEYITGIQTFRAYGIGGTKNKTVTGSMKQFSDISFIYELKIIPVGVIYSILIGSTLPLEILVAGNGWISGTLDTAPFIMICLLPLFLSKLLSTIFVDMTSYKNLMIAKQKINTVLEIPEELQTSRIFDPKRHDIVFEHVGFSYEKGEPVCKDMNIQIENQKLTAIVGDSGSGKSTVLNLIAKYYDPDSGTIRIGGHSIQNVGTEQVLSQISIVEQDVFLFDDTIKKNIRYAKETATDEEIEWACREANCDEFIRKMPRGYETMAGENGNQLSGGERQRLSIARALLKDAPILLLDEATANLDVDNELAVKQAIANLLKKKKTVVMIAHTMSIVKQADQIFVIADGKVKEEGTHEELLHNNGKYAAMWKAEQQL
ncbi:ABC transporter ATP-binding protein [Anaerocolumna sp. MB42-C2]|uniref:ABC transporter ATP-binding protein n=1 Tax=Anaerocolumna sp. MB42-C2 TaxID=3070997 RepID=UPI0027DED7B2|nr:ABC transporter ATP-binding protein [Anaerocolumna sp. MB42-C2]WMJ88014.1 ABC transporter ATP-binding protein [Anaerocolumna sp. MB42-C2]